MKSLLHTFILLAISIGSFAQKDSLMHLFEQKKNNLNHKGMIVLTSWAGATIAGSAAGYGLTNSHEEKQFYLMNGAWGVINLGIALPGLLSKHKPAGTASEVQKGQTRIEKLFLANALLDVAYIAGGLYVKEYAGNQSNIKTQQQFNGYGNAVIIQGAGLFIFDTAMTLLNNRNRKKHLEPLLKNSYFSYGGNCFKIGYRF